MIMYEAEHIRDSQGNQQSKTEIKCLTGCTSAGSHLLTSHEKKKNIQKMKKTSQERLKKLRKQDLEML